MIAPSRRAIVEAAYRLDLSERECIAELARSAALVLDRRRAIAAFVVEPEAVGGEFQVNSLASTDEGLAAAVTRAAQWIPRARHERIAARSPMFASCSQLLGREQWPRMAREANVPEFTGLICPVGRGTVAIGTRRSEAANVSRAEVNQWLPVAAHVSAAWRLRKAIVSSQVESVAFTAGGKALDDGATAGNISAPLRSTLRQEVLRREAARTAHGDDVWPALVAGEWVLVDRFEDSGRRLVIAYRTDVLARPLQALTSWELRSLQRVLGGVANKVVAIELRVSESTVSRLVERALQRLGLANLSDAAELRAMGYCRVSLGEGGSSAELAILQAQRVSGEEGAAAAPPQLTPAGMRVARTPLTLAERAILQEVLRGQTDKQIAAARRTSFRTVSNQVAAIFGKLGVNSRRELVARLLS